MAKVEILVPFILRWEGGFVNDPLDLGGATNKGITIGTFRFYRQKKGLPTPSVQELIDISDQEWMDILKTLYWDKWKADDIQDQSVANILVDWVWASGAYGIKRPQKLLEVTADGIVGPMTLSALNSYPDQKELFDKIKENRVRFIQEIIERRPANRRFERGWLNRINAITYIDYQNSL